MLLSDQFPVSDFFFPQGEICCFRNIIKLNILQMLHWSASIDTSAIAAVLSLDSSFKYEIQFYDCLDHSGRLKAGTQRLCDVRATKGELSCSRSADKSKMLCLSG